MARTKSAVLTPADKRAVIKDAKAKQKELEKQLKAAVKAEVAGTKAYTKAMKAREKLAVTEAKRNDTRLQQSARTIQRLRTALDKQTEQVKLLTGV